MKLKMVRKIEILMGNDMKMKNKEENTQDITSTSDNFIQFRFVDRLGRLENRKINIRNTF